jgi:predicted MFS family arabinose efflux permease
VKLPLKPTQGAWVAVALLWFVAVLNYLDRLVITTVREPIVAEISMTEAQFGLLTAIFLWVYGAASPFCGFLADRYSRRKVIFVSLVLWSVVTWLTGHMHSFTGLFWARAVMGISEACYIPAALALITDFHRGGTRSLATGIHNSGVYVGVILGGVGGYVADAWGWRVAFTALGVIGVGYALILIVLLKDGPREPATPVASDNPRPLAPLRELLARREFLLLLAINIFVSIANWTIYGWLPTYLREHFQLGLGAAGLSAGVYVQAASFIGIMAGGAWADRWNRRNRRARTYVAAFGYCAAAPALFLAGSSNVLAIALAGLVLFGVGRGFYDANLMPIAREFVDERYAATVYGCLNAVGCFAGGAMTYAGGALRDAGMDISIAIRGGAVGVLLAAIMLLMLKPVPQED